jgi:tetratricopeptide (TPR) repeat protein
MQPSATTLEQLAQHYTTAAPALGELARAYAARGRLGEAQRLLRAALELTEAGQVQDRLQLQLLDGAIQVVEHILTWQGAERMLATAEQAQQLAEATESRLAVADALSLLGRARLFAGVTAALQRGAPPDSSPEDGRYDQAQALQQRALEIRVALDDTRGISESHFLIGNVLQFWRQSDLAQAHFAEAAAIAERYGHSFEQVEPARHLAFLALGRGDLDQALALAEQALALREAVRFRPFLPLDHLLLRSIHLARGDQQQAEAHQQHAAALVAELGYQSAPVFRLLPAGADSASHRAHRHHRARKSKLCDLCALCGSILSRLAFSCRQLGCAPASHSGRSRPYRYIS